MELIKEVCSISEKFMKDPQWVKMNYEKIGNFADDLKLIKPPVFEMPKYKNIEIAVMWELVAASINYCYWYGKSNIRPNGSSSTYMYELVMNSFYEYELSKATFHICIDRLQKLLIINRFPLVEERIKHLNELQYGAAKFCNELIDVYHHGINIWENNYLEYFFTKLIQNFPGFGSDIFLKRASLFFIQLYRRFGWLKEEMSQILVPPDYQIPKMLEHYGCITYNPDLKNIINSDQLIPKHSKMECEIRSATILTMNMISRISGWNVADIDTYLFTNRNSCSNKFHLTITTDY